MSRLPPFALTLTLACLLALLPGLALAFGGSGISGNIAPIGKSGEPLCRFEPFLDAAGQEAQVTVRSTTPVTESAGGNYWLGGSVSPWPTAVTAANLMAVCNFSSVTNLVQNGADNGSFGADDYIGVSFDAVTTGESIAYRYEIALSGATVTQVVNTRTVSNTSPTADAGPDQSVASGATVTLDGSGSDANDVGQVLTYAWTQTAGTTVGLSGATTVSPDFTAPALVPGAPDETLTFALVVNDGVEDSVADTVDIIVSAPPNTAPTADAGPDQSVASGASVTLDGSGSDANDAGQSLSHTWTQIGGGPTVSLTGADTATPGFTAPTLAIGDPNLTLTFSLVVNDGVEASVADTVIVTVNAPANTLPTADAGPDQSVASGALVSLDGSGSDPNNPGQSLTYAWTQTGGTIVSLTGATSATPGFTAPVLAPEAPDEVLTFSLIVNDGFGDSLADTVTVTVVAPVNSAPSANAGLDRIVSSGASVTLDGSGSNANDAGQTLTYTWTQEGGIPVSLSGAATVSPSFTAPTLDVGDPDEVLVFSLIVNDGIANSSTSFVLITVTAPVDVTSPTVTLTGFPETYEPGTNFTGTVSFSETVTGFNWDDLTLTNASIFWWTGNPPSGSGQDYVFVIVPASETADISISVPAGVATDLAGNPNEASTTVLVRASQSTRVQEAISDALIIRGRALVASQPNLRRFFGRNGGGLSADITQGTGTFAFSTNSDRTVWANVNGNWADTDGLSSSYGNFTLGAHLWRNQNVILGAMAQIDTVQTDLEDAEFEGTGWLAGPYLVARLPNQPLTFSASYLMGRSENDLTLTGFATDRFESTRRLMTLGVSGDVDLGNGLTVTPSLDLYRLTDEQEAFTTSGGDPVPKQSVTLSEASFGLGLAKVIETGSGALTLTGGIEGIYAKTEALTADTEDTRARVRAGLEYGFGSSGTLSVQTYYDGLGQDDFEAIGASALLEFRF